METFTEVRQRFAAVKHFKLSQYEAELEFIGKRPLTDFSTEVNRVALRREGKHA